MNTNNPAPTHKSSLWIVIEGLDFSGKTTLIKNLRKLIENDRTINDYFHNIIYTKEPNADTSNFCREMREIAINDNNINELTRALIFFANRSEHISRLINPALQKGGSLIICDRFYLSTLSYQTNNDPKMIKWVQETQRIICPNVPDKTYVITIDKETFINRYQKSSSNRMDFMDQRALQEFDSLKNRYEKFMNEIEDHNLGKIVILEGQTNHPESPSVMTVYEDILNKVKEFTQQR